MASVAQLVEQLICNQWVGGSSPSAGSTQDFGPDQWSVSWIPCPCSKRFFQGGVPERSKGTDCKSVGEAFGGSNPPPTTNLNWVDCRRFLFVIWDRIELHDFLHGSDFSYFRSEFTFVFIISYQQNKLPGNWAGVAQLVELQPSKLDVASSSLVSRSKHKCACFFLQLATHQAFVNLWPT